eukprot:COSAG01_NODE_48390_length_381_cov_4.769504_1_plen_20_part_10
MTTTREGEIRYALGTTKLAK